MCFAVADRMQAAKQDSVHGGVSETWLLGMAKGVAGKDTAAYEARILNALAGLDSKGVLEKRRDDGAWVYVLTVAGQQVVAEERQGFLKGLSWLA